MSSLEYSNAAKNILNRFYSVEVMLYVEGDDDIPFWEYMFSKFSQHHVKVQQVGGKKNLEKYADDVFSNRVKALIAMDSDLSIFEDEIAHPNIIKTYGYSIENTLIFEETIQGVIRTIGRLSRKSITIDECREWLDKVNVAILPLLIGAIKNEQDSSGVSVYGDNACKFLKGQKTPELCSNKISNHLERIGFDILDDKAREIEADILSKIDRPIYLLNGHFLFSALLSFVSNTIRKIRSKVSISNESLFGSLLLAFESAFGEDHPHYAHYRNCISGVSIT